jgi:hypothetical protein
MDNNTDLVRNVAAAATLLTGVALLTANKVNARRLARKQAKLNANDTIFVTSVNANTLTA